MGVTTSDRRLRPPRWTRARLERVLFVRYGLGPRGGFNVKAAAADLGVSQRTIYRWLDTPDGRFRASIPTPRLEALIDGMLPSAETLEDEVFQLQNYRNGVAAWNARPRRTKPEWKAQGWLAKHQVSIIKVPGLPLHQVAATATASQAYRVLYRRGEVVDHVTVPTRMHAHVMAYQLLRDYHEWRIHAPADAVKTGRTWCWFSDAPATDLQTYQPGYRAEPEPHLELVERRQAELEARRNQLRARRK